MFCLSPRGIRLKCYYAFFLVCCGCDTSYIVSVHIQCQASIYTLSLCRGHSWRVRLAKQETLTRPGHLVSPLICRGPWISTVVLYCWCHSDSESVLLYFTLLYTKLYLRMWCKEISGPYLEEKLNFHEKSPMHCSLYTASSDYIFPIAAPY